MIQFTCEHCGRRLHSADAHAGQKGKCPACQQPVRIPHARANAAAAGENTDAVAKWSARDAAFLDLAPAASPGERQERAALDSDRQVADEAKGQPAGEEGGGTSSQPSLSIVRALAYPANLDGLVQIGILVLCLWLVSVLGAWLSRFAKPYGGLLAIIAQIIVVGYLVFYVGYCIYDSSHGGQRPPTVSPAHAPDRGDVVSQLLLLVAATAICFWPAALYRGVVGRTDVWFWALGAAGGFFLPMSLLTVALFDAIDALNPLLILRSIVVTLPAYLGLLLEVGVLGGVLGAMHVALGQVPVVRALAPAVYLYLLFVGAHLLGRFYWRHKNRLGWGL